MTARRALLVAALCLGVASSVGAESGSRRVHLERPAIVRIPAGSFLRGSRPEDVAAAISLCASTLGTLLGEHGCGPTLFVEESPARRIHLRAYGIDRTEVTNAAYGRCVRASECAPSRLRPGDERTSQPSHPVAGVTFADAAAYCAFAGGRLPTEAEWERAARGDAPEGRRFPWGDPYGSRLTNHGQGIASPDGVDGHRYAAPVASYPDGASPFGLYDMAGNVWEWTVDRFRPRAYESGTSVDPVGDGLGSERIVRGGSWRSSAVTHRVTYRAAVAETRFEPDLGFRCAY